MNRSGKVLFRVDSDHMIGLGHLERSLSLAEGLRKSGLESCFLTQENSETNRRIQNQEFPISTLPQVGAWTGQDAKATLNTAEQLGCRAVVIDSYGPGTDYFAQLRNGGLYVIAKDDLALFPFPCQMVVNGNANASQLPYQSTTGDTEFLLGIEYIVLGKEFQEDALAKNRHQTVENILVILGGTDPYDIMPKILDSLAMLPGEFKVTAIIGPYFNNLQEIESVVERSNHRIELARNPSSVHSLMQKADLAVSAAGQALYELATQACPTVAIQIAPNQAKQMELMAQWGVIKSAGDAETDDVIYNMAEIVTELMADSQTRIKIGEASRKIVDGKGAIRVAEAIRTAIDSQ